MLPKAVALFIHGRCTMEPVILKLAAIVLLTATITLADEPRMYELNGDVQSRSISFENPTGDKGKGGTAASHLGVGRKGSPGKDFEPGRTYTLCDIEGPGTIHHIWLTVRSSLQTLQGIVIRAYWERQKHPSIEAPLGPFFGVMHATVTNYQSAAHSVTRPAGMNIWLDMPFAESAKLTITNESTKTTPLFYNIDYTVGDKLPAKFGRLHVMYRRENPTRIKHDFEYCPAVPAKADSSAVSLASARSKPIGGAKESSRCTSTAIRTSPQSAEPAPKTTSASPGG